MRVFRNRVACPETRSAHDHSYPRVPLPIWGIPAPDSATAQKFAANLLAWADEMRAYEETPRSVMAMTSPGDGEVPLELAKSIASAIDARKVDLASQIAEDILSQFKIGRETPIEVRQAMISDALQAAKDQAEKLHARAMRLGYNVAYRLG